MNHDPRGRRSAECAWQARAIRHLLYSILLCLTVPSATAATTIDPSYTVSDFGLTTNAVRRVTLTPISPGGDYTNALLAPRPIASATYTNGVATFTNIVSGYAYAVALETVFSTTRRTNYFPTGLSGTINGGDYLAWLAGFATDGRVLQWAWLNITNLSTGLSLTNGNLYNATNTGAITFNGQVLTNGWRDVTNFFAQTGGSGSGINVAAGSRVTASTNGGGTLVTFSADAQTNATLGALAITGAITNVVAGSNATVQIANGIATVNGTVTVSGNLTNLAQSYVFTNLSEMVASPYTNGVVYVKSYWGSNAIGGGNFIHNTNSATTNLGTVFLAANGGYWHRTRPEGSNVWRLEWFGVTPLNSNDPTTRRDSYREITNAVAVSGNHSTLVFPEFGVFTSQDLIFTNWYGRKLKGANSVFGIKNAFPEYSSWLAYQGAGGAGSALLRVWNAYNCEFDGISFDTSTPVNTALSGYYVTNNAETALDLDQYVGGGQIATDNRIMNCTFRSRGTNVVWNGLRISATSEANCEKFVLDNNYFRGGTYNIDLNALGNDSTAILIGQSPNARAHIIKNTTWVSTRYGLVCSNGGFNFEGGLGDATSFDFKVSTWATSTSIKDFYTESSRQCFWIGSGGGTGGKTMPLTIDNYNNYHHNSESNLALIELHGSASLNIKNSLFFNDAFALQRVFTNTPGFSAYIISEGNRYGIAYQPDDWRLGATNFTYFRSTGDGLAKDFTFRRNTWTYDIIDPVGFTNRELFRVEGNALNLSRTNSRVHVGLVPSAQAAANFAVQAGAAPVAVHIGDPEIPSRFSFTGDGTGGSTIAVRATNGVFAQLDLREETGSDLMRLFSGQAVNQFRFGGAPFQLMSSASGGSSGQVALRVNEDTTIILTSTNQSITHNSTNNVFNGSLRVASNSVFGLGLIVSNVAALSIMGTDAGKAITNINLASGLYYDATTNTLSVTSVGSSAWADITGKPDVLTNGHTASITLSNTSTTLRGTLQVAGHSTLTNGFSATNGNNNLNALLGTVAGDDAPAGTYGEAVTNTVATGSAVSLTTATTANIASLSLTAGDWQVFGTVAFNPDTTTTTTYLKAGISTTSATLGPQGSMTVFPIAVAVTDEDAVIPTPSVRINVTSTTTVYLVARAAFATSTMTAYGQIFARRPR